MRQEAKRWWEQALEDLKTVESLLADRRYAAAAFYSQQAVEKALKAMIVVKCTRTAPWIHNLLELLQVLKTCMEIAVPQKLLSYSRQLNHHYTVPRYPDAANGLPEEQYDELISTNAYQQAEEIIKWVKDQIILND